MAVGGFYALVGACRSLINTSGPASFVRWAAGYALVLGLLGTGAFLLYGWTINAPPEAPPPDSNVLQWIPNPTPTTRPMPSRFQPGEKESIHATVREVVADAMADAGNAVPTDWDYTAACSALKRHRWDPERFYADPDATERLTVIAGTLDSLFTGMTKLREERQLASYTLLDFCADAPSTGETNLSLLSANPTSLPPRQPMTVPSPTFQPGEREYRYQMVRELMDEVLASGIIPSIGQPTITDAEYRATCAGLRKHNWDIVGLYIEPDTTTRMSAIAGGLQGGLAEMNHVAEERGWARYSLEDFCDDVQT